MSFLNTYKTPILIILFILGVFGYLHHLSVKPIKDENRRIKSRIKQTELKNEELLKKTVQDSLVIIEISKKIEKLEKSQTKYESEIPKIHKDNEKIKNSYISSDLNERRRKFSELANE